MQTQIIAVKADGDEGTFSGLLSTYGNIDSTGDVCEAGCYDRTVKERGTKRPLLWQHNQDSPIGSLEIVATEGALAVSGRVNMGTTMGKDAYALLKAGDIDGMSIGYIARDYDYDSDGIRHLKDVDLLEGSLVTLPANELARVASVKSGGTLMKKAVQMKSLESLTPEQRKAVLDELKSLEELSIGEADDGGSVIVGITDAPVSGAKADESEEEEEGSEEDEKSCEDDEDKEDEDEIEDALNALKDAIAKLKRKMEA